MTATAVDPYLQAYYKSQLRNVNDSYFMGLAQNNEQKSLTDLSYQQKLSALQDRLNQEQTTVADPYANRGLLNSGIWNYNGVDGSLGGKQQFALNKGLALSNLTDQQSALDGSYALKNTQLGITDTTNTDNLVNLSKADQMRSTINDAIAGA